MAKREAIAFSGPVKTRKHLKDVKPEDLTPEEIERVMFKLGKWNMKKESILKVANNDRAF